MADTISQKDYLKKYLSGSKNGDKKKKKKRQHRAVGGSLKIIDDDFDLSKLRTLDESELDLFNTNEDTPQIVGIVDDRPLEMKTLDEYQQNNKWKTINNDLELSTNTPQNLKSSSIIERPNYDSDASPPRLSKHIRSISDTNGSLPTQSDPTKKRYSVEKQNITIHEIDCSPRRRHSSPVSNRNIHSSNNQLLTIKVENSDSDCSPPRKASNREKSPDEYNISRRIDKHKSRTRSRSPRYKLSNNDGNQNRTRNRNKTKEDVDRHRSKKQNTSYNSDSSLARQDRHKIQKVVKRQDSDNDNSPPRRRLHSDSESKKMSKTLDGKTAGLQDAKSLRVENESMKRRENDLFNALDEKKSGRNAETIVRDRKTGKKRDLAQEQKHESEKREKNKERTEKYSRWGRGLKQDADYKARLQSDLHEMSKPLARYADDTDLEKHLRDKDRAGDPMLDYMRRKEMENKVTQGIEVKPLFKGSFPANRFDIRPGYRWDGVSRSNGYEKSWFENINSKKATEEAAYKWSTEDM